jgi:hypothetical protein
MYMYYHYRNNIFLPVLIFIWMRMFRDCEMAGASTTVRRSSILAGFTYHQDPDGEYVLGFDVQKIRD